MSDQSAFMAGVALMGEMLREAERQAAEGRQPFWIEASLREGTDLSLYLRPLVAKLPACPELVDGFSAALGDYLGTIHAGVVYDNGDVYTHLSYDDIMMVGSREAAPPVSNVVPLRVSSQARGKT